MPIQQSETTSFLSEEFLQEQARLLGHAASDGELTLVRSILEKYPGVVHVRGGIMQSTPLHFAADRGLFEIVTLLIAAGADVNAREGATGTTPLHWAAIQGQLEMVRLLIRHNANAEITDDWYRLAPLGWAAAIARTPQLPVIDYLQEQGAELDIFSAVALSRVDEVHRIVAANPGVSRQQISLHDNARSPLHFAALRDLPEMVETLLGCGVDINGKTEWGQTALCLASKQDNRAVVDLLQRWGAAQDLSTLLATDSLEQAQEALTNQPDLLGEYPLLLHGMTHENGADAATLLLDHGADPDVSAGMVVDELLCQVTPLHRASFLGHAEVVRALLAKGADKDRQTAGYWEVTPLHLAAWRGHENVVRLLLEQGANPQISAGHGIGTPLDWATIENQDAIFVLLKAHG